MELVKALADRVMILDGAPPEWRWGILKEVREFDFSTATDQHGEIAYRRSAIGDEGRTRIAYSATRRALRVASRCYRRRKITNEA
jgi:hypothetical protein